MDENFLRLLANELGKITSFDKECPGVYYLGCISTGNGIGRGYYVALIVEDAPISKEVRAMGKPIESTLMHTVDFRL